MRIRPRERKQTTMFGFENSSSDSESSCSPPPAKSARTPQPKKSLKPKVRSPSLSPPPPPPRAAGKKTIAAKLTVIDTKPAVIAAPKAAAKAKRGAAITKDAATDSSSDDDSVAPAASTPPARVVGKKSTLKQGAALPSNKACADDANCSEAVGQHSGAAQCALNSPPGVTIAVEEVSKREITQKAQPKRVSKKTTNSLPTDPPAPAPNEATVCCVAPPVVDAGTDAALTVAATPAAAEDAQRMRATVCPAIEWFTLHYADKVGVPYIFTNGDCGVCFNDGSCMQVSDGGEGGKLSRRLLYVNKHQHYFTITASNESLIAIPRRLEKKLFAVLWCRQYLKGEKHSMTGVQCKQVADAPRWSANVPVSADSGIDDDASLPPAYISAVTTGASPEFMLSNSAKPYPNDTYYLSGDDRP